MDGNKESGTPLSQSLVANIQLGLPGTISKLSAKMRFIDLMAPLLKEAGVIKNVELLHPFSIRASGISTSNRTTNAFGGILYAAGAVRQDVLIQEGAIYKTRQESLVSVDEIDDLDLNKKLKFINMINTYRLLEEMMNDDEKPDLIMTDIPLVLERSDAPPEGWSNVQELYKKCRAVIKQFWVKNKENIFPFNEQGVKVASIGSKRFGAVIFAINKENISYVADRIDLDKVARIETEMPRIREVGIKRLLQGILVKRTRTAAFQFDVVNKDNRLEPELLRNLGVTGMHIKAGNNTPPLLVEVVGSVTDWTPGRLDRLASEVMTLITFDQAKALPIPLWYAKYALKPLEVKPGVLEFYKAQTRERLKNEDLEQVWKQDLDAFED